LPTFFRDEIKQKPQANDSQATERIEGFEAKLITENHGDTDDDNP
jgi:hypothetical protein